MTRSSIRTPFQIDNASLADGMEDKSADVGLEVKTLDADDTDDDADATEAQTAIPDSPLPTGDNAPASDDPTIEVEFLHHYQAYVPGDTDHLPARLAESLINGHRAVRVEKA